MKSLTDDIRGAIEEHLPKQVGDVLCQQLAEVDQLQKKNNELNRVIDSLKSKTEMQEEKIADLQSAASAVGDMDERESIVAQRETDLDVTCLRTQLDATQMVNDRIMGFVDALMRNTTYRERVVNNVSNFGSYDNPAPACTDSESANTAE